MLHLSRGVLIALEGIDGSGKSTLARSVFKELDKEGFATVLTKEPGDSNLGKHIRELVQIQNLSISSKAQYLLFAADRAQHFTELVIPALQEKKIIISDRLCDSSLAYQGYGNGLSLDMIHTVNEWSMNYISVDLTIFVQIPVDIALERCNKRGELSLYERKDFLQKVSEGFEHLYKNQSHVIIVDGTDSLKNLTTIVSDAIKEWIHTQQLLL